MCKGRPDGQMELKIQNAQPLFDTGAMKQDQQSGLNATMGPLNMVNAGQEMLNKDKQATGLVEQNTQQITNVTEVIPPVNIPVKQAEPQSVKLGSLEDTGKFLGVSETFAEVQEHDSERMAKVRACYKAFLESNHDHLLTDRDTLNELISACRWYNLTRWSPFSKARKRQAEVKAILEHAKKERSRIEQALKEEEATQKQEKAAQAKRNKDLAASSQIELIHSGNQLYDKTDQAPTVGSTAWAVFKGYTFGFIGRNLLNLAMGAVAGAAWLASYPIARAYGAITKNAKYKKGFNIKIPRPMSPQGWVKYYRFDQRHVTMAMSRSTPLMAIPMMIGKTIQYNLWDPIKHIFTLDMKHLAGGSYVTTGEDERELIKDRADEEYRSLLLREGENDDDDDDDNDDDQ